jgi:hypothetical protein
MDTLILGSGSVAYQADAVANFAQGAETATRLRLRGKMHAPGSPAGEFVFRRIHVTVVHDSGCGFWLMPVVDGVPLPQDRAYLSRPAPPAGTEERHVFMVPMVRRGSVIEIEIDAPPPTARWHVETVTFAISSRNQARGRRVSE